MGWVIFWVLCGVASAIIGGNKGLNGFAWFLFGCLVGPFGILFALTVPKQTQADAAGYAPWWANAWFSISARTPQILASLGTHRLGA